MLTFSGPLAEQQQRMVYDGASRDYLAKTGLRITGAVRSKFVVVSGFRSWKKYHEQTQQRRPA